MGTVLLWEVIFEQMEQALNHSRDASMAEREMRQAMFVHSIVVLAVGDPETDRGVLPPTGI